MSGIFAGRKRPEWFWRFSLDSVPDPDPMFGIPPSGDPLIRRSFELEVTFAGERVFYLRGIPDESMEPYAFVDRDRMAEMVDRANASLRAEENR
jgi:hypothetical protein